MTKTNEISKKVQFLCRQEAQGKKERKRSLWAKTQFEPAKEQRELLFFYGHDCLFGS
jgi:ABC-type tungstate transport system permease subunit